MKNQIISFRKLAQMPTNWHKCLQIGTSAYKINVAGPQNKPVHTKCKNIFVRSQRRQEEVLGNRDFLEQCE